MRHIATGILNLVTAAVLAAPAAQAKEPCGDVISINAPAGGAYRVALAIPESKPPLASLILLPGGGGFANLDEQGCAQALTGNSLIRSVAAFRAGGMVAALADAPAEYQGREGLGGFRIDARHATALGLLVRELRQRFPAPVWIVGTSRGAISAANAAARLGGGDAPDGVVLTSPVTVGTKGAMLWTIQSVFDLPLKQIAAPLLLVGHAADQCLRSPPTNLGRLAAATASGRQQIVTLTGGPGSRFTAPSLDACEGREPHGFADQETDAVAGIIRFVTGGRY